MYRPVHFEIHATDPQQLITFYTDLFGWTISKWEGGDYWLIDTGPKEQPGINGGLMARRGPPPAEDAPVSAFAITMGVDNLDTMVEKAVAIGGTICLAKMPIKGMGWLAYAKDPDGNIFGMMQPDASAA